MLMEYASKTWSATDLSSSSKTWSVTGDVSERWPVHSEFISLDSWDIYS